MQHGMHRLFHAVLLSTLLIAVSPGSIAAQSPEIEFQEEVPFGTGGDVTLKLNLARPADLAERVPGLVFIHGGGWTGGNKDSFDKEIKEMAKHGYVVASIDYRLAPEYSWPAQIEDCKCAVRWMRSHADDLGIDPERIGALGGSAGAHLALLLGTMDTDAGLEGDGGWSEQPSKVQAVVSFVGPSDMRAEWKHANQARLLASLAGESPNVVEAFLGGAPEDVPDHYDQASPLFHVNKGDAPALLFQGTRDLLVPFPQAFDMATRLTKADVPGRVEFILGAGHSWGGREMERTVDATLAFFDRYLIEKDE